MARLSTNTVCRTILLSLFLLAWPVLGGGESKDVGSAPDSVTTALGCLVARDFIRPVLVDLKLTPGRFAWIRYYIGTIPGMEPTPGEFYIAVYSEDGFHGWLLLSFRDPKGKFIAVRNGYRLTKVGSHWNADEGNGGMWTYNDLPPFSVPIIKRVPGQFLAFVVLSGAAGGGEPPRRL
jgi:hypothetical protein